jgi:hypothetical protein
MQFRTLLTVMLFAIAAAASPTLKPLDKADKATTKPKPTKKPKPSKPTTTTKGPVKKA